MRLNGKVEMRDSQVRSLVRGGILGAVLLVVLNLAFTVTYAQQLPPGRIAYTKYPLGGIDFKELWLINSDTTNNKQLLPLIQLGGFPGFASVASIGLPVWSRDGSRIAANAMLSSSSPGDLDPLQQLIWNRLTLATPTNVLVVFDPAKNQGSAVFNLDINTGTATGVVASQWINAAFSPDSKRLAYAAQELNFVEYAVINVDGTGKVPLFSVNLTENALGLGIDWSPRLDQVGNGGNLLVLSYPLHFSDPTCSNMPRTVAALFLTDSQGKVIRQLTQPPQPQQACSLFVADPLLLLDPSTFDSVNDLWPAFSPDGTEVAFVRSVRDSMSNVTQSCIMAVKVNGTTNPPQGPGTCSPQPGERALIYLPGMEIDHLSWSPDGSRLMFDVTQMLYGGLYPNPLGIYTTSSAGGGDVPGLLAPPATAAAWGRPQ